MYGQPTQTSTSAVLSLVLGLLGLFILGFLTAIPAVICGHVALSEMKKNHLLEGKGLAIAGLVTGYIGIFLGPLTLVLILLILSSTQAAPFIYTLF